VDVFWSTAKIGGFQVASLKLQAKVVPRMKRWKMEFIKLEIGN
jgi:hypothetical protein